MVAGAAARDECVELRQTRLLDGFVVGVRVTRDVLEEAPISGLHAVRRLARAPDRQEESKRSTTNTVVNLL